MFGYRSGAVVDRCISRFGERLQKKNFFCWLLLVSRYANRSNATTEIGRHAVHALDALLGARNAKAGGRTYAAVYEQADGRDGGEVELIFANRSAESEGDYRLHVFILSTRERFGHQNKSPARGVSRELEVERQAEENRRKKMFARSRALKYAKYFKNFAKWNFVIYINRYNLKITIIDTFLNSD